MIYNISGHILLNVLRNQSSEFLLALRLDGPGPLTEAYIDRVIQERVTAGELSPEKLSKIVSQEIQERVK